jgi:hypothetical protein
MLQTLYAPGVPRGDTGRWRSTADVERNLPPTALTRADLGWRSLLHAAPMLPPVKRAAVGSIVLEGQGIAVLRRESGRVYVGLDYGHSGGGHGHPDRLNLLLADGQTRWLDDMGTGSYVDRSLFWYRSTLAHNAPLFDGKSQERVHGRLLAYDERGAAGWVDAAVEEIAPGVSARRSVIVMPDYLVDELSWSGQAAIVDLPFHLDGELRGPARWDDAPLTGGETPEDGFEFLRDTQRSTVTGGRTVCIESLSNEKKLDVWFRSNRDVEWWRATAPGPPASGDRRFHLARLRGEHGALRSVWSWAGAVANARLTDETLEVTLVDGSHHVHMRRPEGWHVDLVAGRARSSIDLSGSRHDAPATAATPGVYGDATTVRPPSRGEPLALPWTAQLGEEHYRRSEESWQEAGSPTAMARIAWHDGALRVTVDVKRQGEPIFAAPDAVNRYDNEYPDINGDGLQLYVRTPDGDGGWVLVPNAADTSVRVRPIAGWADLPAPRASWRRADGGYSVDVAIPIDVHRSPRIELDVLVNETAPGRERRRGQLVLSGAAGEFAYLAGDRHDPARLLAFTIAP